MTHPKRRLTPSEARIAAAITRPMTMRQIVSALPDMNESTIASSMTNLKRQGVVEASKTAPVIYQGVA